MGGTANTSWTKLSRYHSQLQWEHLLFLPHLSLPPSQWPQIFELKIPNAERWKGQYLPSIDSLCSDAQLCLILCNPMDCRPGSSVHGIFLERILEWVAMLSSTGSSQPRDWNRVSYISCIGRWILYHQATGEAYRRPLEAGKSSQLKAACLDTGQVAVEKE